jgi:hypothetical protein
MMGEHVLELVQHVNACEALVTGLCGAEAEWQTRHAAERAVHKPVRDTAMAEMEETRKVAFDKIDKAAEQRIRDFNPAAEFETPPKHSPLGNK